MSVREATFHFETSALNVGLLAKTDAMLVTAAVFQSAMLPYVAAAVVGSVAHAVAAAPMFAFVMAVWQLTWAGREASTAVATSLTPKHNPTRAHRRGGAVAVGLRTVRRVSVAPRSSEAAAGTVRSPMTGQRALSPAPREAPRAARRT
jgi:hypothetical protein